MGGSLENAQIIVGISVSIVVALSGLITGIISLVSKNKANRADIVEKKAEASQSIVEAARSLIEPLQERIVHLETDNRILRAQQIKLECNITELRERIRRFEIGTQRLVFQIKATGNEPVWNPAEEGDVGERVDE